VLQLIAAGWLAAPPRPGVPCKLRLIALFSVVSMIWGDQVTRVEASGDDGGAKAAVAFQAHVAANPRSSGWLAGSWAWSLHSLPSDSVCLICVG